MIENSKLGESEEAKAKRGEKIAKRAERKKNLGSINANSRVRAVPPPPSLLQPFSGFALELETGRKRGGTTPPPPSGLRRIRISLRSSLTLSMHEGLIQIPAKQRIRQIAEIFLEESRYVVGALIRAYLGLATAIEVLPQLQLIIKGRESTL